MTKTTSPTLVVIDVQKEYITPGRPFYLSGIEPSLSNARRLLEHARAEGWSIIHVQHLQDGAVFNRDDPASGFIESFEPFAAELHVKKDKLSAFTNPQFAAAIEAADSADIFVMGYGSTMCCLATVVDAPLYGRKLTFVHDASWARAPGPAFNEAETHRHATAIIGIHGKLATVEQVMHPPTLTRP
jgi:ureidoacrylate peracid hydrolase